jgi:threonylcarbamoyladenosine tRNA methylthiotransferase MtaB
MFAEDQVGSSNEVLFERQNDKGFWEGYTKNYVRVWVKSKSDLKNQIRHVYLNDFVEGQLRGEILN